MKYITFLLFFVAMGFNCVAESNKDFDKKEIGKGKQNLINHVINPMQKIAAQLEQELKDAQTLYDRLKDRSISHTDAPTQEDNNLEEYLNSFSSLENMFTENANDGGFVLEQINNSSDDSDLKSMYKLIFDMKESLNQPYDEASNNAFIKAAANNSNVLPQHRAEFDKLMTQINDYNYYMFELARMFEAADEDKYRKPVKALVKAEDAEYLLEVPYTKRMLENYYLNRGLTPKEKAELKKACSDAFPNF